jgi:hypothetical protein
MRAMSQFATQFDVAPATARAKAQTLRDEARLLTLAGVILLAIGFPLTLWLASLALSPKGLTPLLPIVAGGPPIALGYTACHFASKRLARARDLEIR